VSNQVEFVLNMAVQLLLIFKLPYSASKLCQTSLVVKRKTCYLYISQSKLRFFSPRNQHNNCSEWSGRRRNSKSI